MFIISFFFICRLVTKSYLHDKMGKLNMLQQRLGQLGLSFKKLVLYAGISGGLAFFAGPPLPAYAAPRGAACVDCHENTVKEFNKSFHARIWQGEKNDCDVCHGPSEQHLKDPNPSPKSIISFTKGSGRSADELSKQCLACHNKTPQLAMWDMGQHSRNDVSCASCHTIHKKQMVVDQPTVCFNCHKDIKAAVRKRSHHPIIEGKVLCYDCHNPHGAMSPSMVRAGNINQLCYKCHPDKRGPYVFEHPPVEENCTTCHTPHGSIHTKLLVESLPNLCQDCHDYSRHPGTPYDAKNGFTGSRPVNRFYGRACLNCHGAIHGSADFTLSKMTR